MQPLKYQKSSPEQRKAVVLEIAKGLKYLDKNKYPKISLTINSGNNKKNQLVELLIQQMYANNFDLEDSLLAVEENT